jgi:hypothetical protein
MKTLTLFILIFFSMFALASLYAKSIDGVTGEGPNLDPRISQSQVIDWPLPQIQNNGIRIFSTPFNFYDGYGDGPYDDIPSINEGERPTLQANGTFLRVNGLDAQTCAECHFIKSNSTIPFTFELGGTAGGAANVLLKPAWIEADIGKYNGRFINSPILFGAGGIELLAKEMTLELQALRQEAIDSPGTIVDLVTKGVSFGFIFVDSDGSLNTSNVEGIDDDLVLRPFGRKGQFATSREFDVGALRFHFGMEPVEIVGEDTDIDGDGVVNEVTVGEVSALNIWVATRPSPRASNSDKKAEKGFKIFEEIGCTECHIPVLQTNKRELTFSYPEVSYDPTQNVFRRIDLVSTSGFRPNNYGGVEVTLFADLKRHDMGEGLAEEFHLAGDEFNAQFTTARLWGVADSAPYLHDGRALTITDAILLLGGEAEAARNSFIALSQDDMNAVLAFLYSLRNPR